ncbi:MAG: Pr6Pr family membrane protein [Actinomycetota bacterium]|nr:Pr6Pr family membrane protein [Actinomycetota bacterium]
MLGPVRGRSPVGTGLRVAIVANILLAFVIVLMTSRSGLWWRFSTFTYEVNLLAALYFLWAVLRPAAARRLPGLRGAIVLYVLVAGLIWNLYLTDMSMGYTPQNIMLHIVSPVLVGLDWLLIGRSQERVAWWHPVAWLGYPLAYLIAILVYLNTERGRFLYYFLDVQQIGLVTLTRNVALLALGFAVLGYIVLGIGRLAVAARRTPA